MGLAAGAALVTLPWAVRSTPRPDRRPVKVGILHSLTGTMAISERSVVDAELMAVEEVNAAGGVLGRPLLPVLVDGRSDWPTFARGAERLLGTDRVAVIFGCWTSASRRTTVPVLERMNGLMVYPVQYEGVEQSPNVVYTGAAPNQQVIPAVKWFLENRGKRFFLVGSDYVFPRTANAIIRDELSYLGGQVVGEEYVPLGGKDFGAAVRGIVATRPDVILNTINGDSNLAFFRGLRAAGVRPADIPTVSFSLAEDEFRAIDDLDLMAGDYAAWNYFQSDGGPDNRAWVRRFKRRYGAHRVTDDPMEAGYFGVHLWAGAVRAAGSTDVDSVRAAIRWQSYPAPEGTVYVDTENQHTWKRARIGQIRRDGQFDVVWESETLIHPEPFPDYRTEHEWRAFVQSLYEGWGHAWASPGPS